MKETDEVKEFDDEKPLSKKDLEVPTPVDAAPLVQQYLSDPDNQLVLRQDPAADQMLARTNFTNKNTMLSSILGDIAARMLTKTPDQDRVANFASSVADNISQEGEPFFEPHKNYIRDKKVAFQLAKRYIDDFKKMKQDPEYASQVRMDPAAYEPKKDRKGKAKEEIAFEGWADNITEQKPYVSMYRGEDGKMVYDVLDKDGESAYKSSDYDTATAYLSKNFDRLAGKQISNEPKGLDVDAFNAEAQDDVNENPEETVNETDEPMIIDGKEVDSESIEYDMQDYSDVIAPISSAKFIDGTDLTDDQMADLESSSAYINWVRQDYDERAMSMADDVNTTEGNEFAQAVQKAKAAGMKPGDKFEVGGKEYTLKDAIEQAGLKLEEFFSEEEQSDDETSQGNSTEIDRIKNLAFYQ
jgi:hypothetical protein